MSEIPVACTLSSDEMGCQADRLLPGLAAASSSVAWTDAGIQMVFEPVPGRIAMIASVIDRERQCCQFLRFELTVPPGGDPFQLAVTGPEGTVPFLESILGPRAG